MKVLQINSVCGIRSTGRICTDISVVLCQTGDECRIVYGREMVPEIFQKYAHRVGNDFSVKIDAIKTRLLDNAGFNSKKATKELIAWIEDYNPDIIHLHNIHGYYINIEILFEYLKIANKPVIWTLHDCWAFTGHCSHFSLIDCNKWKTMCQNCPQTKNYPSSLFFDNSEKNFKKKKQLFTSLDNMTLVTPSEWLAGKVRESFLGKYDVISIPNGIDLEIFKPTKSNFREKYGFENKKIILGVSTFWDESKGIKDFVELSKILPSDYQIVLVGISEEEVRAKGLPQNIFCMSRTNSVKELSEIYTAADVFVNPSRQETMGLVTVEAMACGTPVVVSNYTAVPEVVTEAGGIVLDSISAESILEGINYIFSRNYDNTVANAEKFEKKQQYYKYINLYKTKVIKSEI